MKIKRIRSLKTRFIFYVTLFFLIFCLSLFYLYNHFKIKFTQEIEKKINASAKMILLYSLGDTEKSYLSKSWNPDINNPIVNDLQQNFFKICELLEFENIYIIDKNLKIILSAKTETSHPSKFQKDRFEINSVFDKSEIRTSRLFRSEHGRHILLCYAPIEINNEVIYALAIEVSSDLLKILNIIRDDLLLMIAAGLFLILIISLFFSNQILKPISLMVKFARNVSNGDFTAQLVIKNRQDEINFLARAFNEMVSNIAELTEILKQKELVAVARAEKVESKLKESEYLYFLGTMSAIVAHEVRNPLGGISGFVELLERKLPATNENIERLLKKIKEEIKKLNKVTTDFLFLSSGKKLDLIAVNLRKSIDNCLKLVECEALTKKNIVENRVDESIMIYGDETFFEKALLNILLNAIAASPESDGRIIFECSISQTDKDCINFYIKDNGYGIDAETEKKLFNIFYTTKKTGAGIGLAITRKIIELHNGEISIARENNFTVVILKLKKYN